MGIKSFNKYHFLHILHLQELPSQFLSKFLKISRFAEDLTWYGKLFQILAHNTLRILMSNVFWFHLGISKFNLYLSGASLTFMFH